MNYTQAIDFVKHKIKIILISILWGFLAPFLALA
jgi:hypothetical protein